MNGLMKVLIKTSTHPLAIATALGLLSAACGQFPPAGTKPDGAPSSQLEWIRSRPQSERYAFLTPADLSDTFLFGASVIHVDHFLSNALNMVIRPIKVKLFLEKESGEDSSTLSQASNQLQIKIQEGGRWHTLLSFDAQLSTGQAANAAPETKWWEIDFASSGNDLSFNNLIDTVGGMHTAMNISGRWISQAAPRVLQVSQDENTVVIDLLHTVKQSIEGELDTANATTATLAPEPSRAGLVTVRIWLKRQLPQNDTPTVPTVTDALKLNLGFFGATLVPAPNSVVSSPIQHFSLPTQNASAQAQKITFYLKDFPSEYFEVGRTAVLSWNKAFNQPVLEVAKAPEWLDAGDPRYHLIKWFDGTDQNLPWAGVAKMQVDPDSGLVLSGGIYIQGNTLVELYRKIHTYSEQAARGGLREMRGSLGRASFDAEWGEAPVVPYFTDVKADFASYIREYYLETIAHEVGHVLGLRHNFKGSTEVQNQHAASVMDYLPRAQRANFRGPGRYDIAAIRWAYYGEVPRTELPYCTDDQLWKLWDCSQGDYGEPITYIVQGLLDGSKVLAQKPIEIGDTALIASMVTTAENAFKLWKLRAQLANSERQKVETELPKALKFLFTVEPAEWLNEGEKAIVLKNLESIRQLVRTREAQLRSVGTL